MSGPALAHAYAYASPSALARRAGQAQLALATSGGASPHPFFFAGRLLAPQRAANALLAVARVARTRFHVPPGMLERILREADPVVTCQPERVRFEAFSACCGVYARFDLHAGGFAAEHLSPGTTNVDFNPELRALLARISAAEDLHLSVGAKELRVTSGEASARERKVPLPLRWIRGFGEVHALTSRMTPVFEVSALFARRFLRGLSKQTSSKGALFVAPAGDGLRVSHLASRDAVPVAGLARLAILNDAAEGAERLVVYAEPGGSSAWELMHPEGRFVLALSPEVWRGFSGEGALLEDLARDAGDATARLRASLAWQSALVVDDVAREHGLDVGSVRSALAALATRGLVGFELGRGVFFHRELPFRLDLVDAAHPRLVDARRLLEAGAVSELVTSGGVRAEVRASGGTGAYQVRVVGDEYRCTCPWYGKHQGERGPCKHVLAVQIAVERRESRQ